MNKKLKHMGPYSSFLQQKQRKIKQNIFCICIINHNFCVSVCTIQNNKATFDVFSATEECFKGCFKSVN